jgi:hypothetical protein
MKDHILTSYDIARHLITRWGIKYEGRARARLSAKFYSKPALRQDFDICGKPFHTFRIPLRDMPYEKFLEAINNTLEDAEQAKLKLHKITPWERFAHYAKISAKKSRFIFNCGYDDPTLQLQYFMAACVYIAEVRYGTRTTRIGELTYVASVHDRWSGRWVTSFGVAEGMLRGKRDFFRVPPADFDYLLDMKVGSRNTHRPSTLMNIAAGLMKENDGTDETARDLDACVALVDWMRSVDEIERLAQRVMQDHMESLYLKIYNQSEVFPPHTCTRPPVIALGDTPREIRDRAIKVILTTAYVVRGLQRVLVPTLITKEVFRDLFGDVGWDRSRFTKADREELIMRLGRIPGL